MRKTIAEMQYYNKNDNTVITLPKVVKGILCNKEIKSAGIYAITPPASGVAFNYSVVNNELTYRTAPDSWTWAGQNGHATRLIRLRVFDVDINSGGQIKALQEAMVNEFMRQGVTPVEGIPLGSIVSTETYIYLQAVTLSSGFVYDSETNTLQFQAGTGSEIMRTLDPSMPVIRCEFIDENTLCRTLGDLIIAT